jgi:membrane protein YdbS with pleckstrin-like domain
MPDRPNPSARLVQFLWFLTTVFSVFAVVVRYRRTGDVAWYLIAAAAFTLVMGIVTLRRSR